jgi:hypothetical protein
MSSDYVVYATCYPGVEPYLPQWRNSVLAQTDKEFDLAIGLDVITPIEAKEMLGPDIDARFLTAPAGATPAGLRNHAFAQLAEDYEGVIMTDMDDLLQPDRVRGAKAMLSASDLCCCAMQVMDADGRVQGVVFDPGAGAQNILLGNVFGLGNTAYRSRLLKQCLPVPANCVLMDWLMATRALASGATIAIDRTPQMVYRQYPNNTARILPPFSNDQILKACELVLGHYSLALAEAPERFPQMLDDLQRVSESARHFSATMLESRALLCEYVKALNELPAPHVWWDCVAHPTLETRWKH